MKNTTICSAAIEAIKKSGKSMTAAEIYDFIIRNNLYQFKAKEPVNMVKSMLRKHTEGINTPTKKGVSFFQLDGTGKYQILK